MTSSDKVMRQRHVGRRGEEIAAEYLTALGWRVEARNWRCSAGEVDIVARDGRTLVLCEVKCRSGLGFGAPIEAVTMAKQRKLRELAHLWRREQAYQGPLRIDVVGVLLRPGWRPEISHVRDVGA